MSDFEDDAEFDEDFDDEFEEEELEDDGFHDAMNCGSMEDHSVHLWWSDEDEEYICDGGW